MKLSFEETFHTLLILPASVLTNFKSFYIRSELVLLGLHLTALPVLAVSPPPMGTQLP